MPRVRRYPRKPIDRTKPVPKPAQLPVLHHDGRREAPAAAAVPSAGAAEARP